MSDQLAQAVVVAALVATASSALAQDQTPTETPPPSEAVSATPDRPSFSAGTAVTPPGHAQFEAGVDYALDSGTSSLAFPVLLTRVGVAENFELRAGFPSWQFEFRDAGTESSLGAMRLESKIAGKIGETVSVGALPFFDFPVDTDEGFGRTDFGFLALGSFDVSPTFNVTLNGGIQTVTLEGDAPRGFEFPTILTLGFAFTDALGAYLETYNVFSDETGMRWAVDGGASFAITRWLVVDAYVGAGLQEDLPDFFGGAGLTLAR